MTPLTYAGPQIALLKAWAWAGAIAASAASNSNPGTNLLTGVTPTRRMVFAEKAGAVRQDARSPEILREAPARARPINTWCQCVFRRAAPVAVTGAAAEGASAAATGALSTSACGTESAFAMGAERCRRARAGR